jgi:hypothetical protein
VATVAAKKEREKNMKLTSLTRWSVNGSLALAVAGLISAPAGLFAQEKGVIRHMRLLNADKPAAEAAAPAAEKATMSCAKCKDSWVSFVERPTKGAGLTQTRSFLRHDCPGCKTEVVTSGHGKAATQTVAHTCTENTDAGASCCVMK